MEKVVPEYARDIFPSGQQKPPNILVGLPIHGGRDEEIFNCKPKSQSQNRATFLIQDSHSRLSTCCKATCASCGNACCASVLSINVSGFWGAADAIAA